MRRFLFLLFTFFGTQAFAHGISNADKQSMINGGFLEYIKFGASHMLTGYDHLLFLFGVVFFLATFKDIIKFITAFTFGHCITLVFATFLGVTINSYLIDAIIALSVIYKGFENLDGFNKVFKKKSPNLLVLVFIFGLIHGLGLSTRLQELPLGIDGLLLKILSFNLGVELGQIGALAVMLSLIELFRNGKFFKIFSIISNSMLIIAGILLFMFQINSYVNTTNVIQKNSENSDTVKITIAAGKSLEYKFFIIKGSLFEYSWKTNNGKLFFDFHGEPAGDKTGYFKSYVKTTNNTSKGNLIAPFDGSHGWYWKNKTPNTIVVTLVTKGRYRILGIR